MTVPARLAWVWREPPGPLHGGLDGVIVRAANGNVVTTKDHFNYADNYAAWRREHAGRVTAWTYIYPSSDGRISAEALHGAAAGAALYVADIEDPVPAAVVTAFCKRLRQLEPHAVLGFSSYPTRKQATDHGVPWDTCVDAFDLGFPQVYFPSQRARIAQVIDDHHGKPVHVALSPADDDGWQDLARTGLGSHSGVSLWRYGLKNFASWASHLGHVTAKVEEDFTTDELLDALASPRGQKALKDAVTDVLRAGLGGLAPGQTDNTVRPGQRWLFETVAEIQAKVDG
jgi:hypothetical protein